MAGLLTQVGRELADAETRAKNAKAPRTGFFSVLDELVQDLPSGRDITEKELRERLKPNAKFRVDDMEWPLKQEEIDYVLNPALKGVPPRGINRDNLLAVIRETRPMFESVSRQGNDLRFSPYRFEAENEVPGSYLENITESPSFDEYATHFGPGTLSFSRGAQLDSLRDPLKKVTAIQEIQNDRANTARKAKFMDPAELLSHEGPPPRVGWRGPDYHLENAKLVERTKVTEQRLRAAQAEEHKLQWEMAKLDPHDEFATTGRSANEAAILPLSRDLNRISQETRRLGEEHNKALNDLHDSWDAIPDAPFKEPGSYGNLELKTQILNSLDDPDVESLGITPRSPVGMDESGHTYANVYPGLLKRLGNQYKGGQSDYEVRTRGAPIIDLAEVEPHAGGRDYFPNLNYVFDPEMYHRGEMHPIYPPESRFSNLDEQVEQLLEQHSHKFADEDRARINKAQADFRAELARYNEAQEFRDSYDPDVTDPNEVISQYEQMDIDDLVGSQLAKYKEAVLDAERNARHARGDSMRMPVVDFVDEFRNRVKKYGFPLFNAAGAALLAPWDAPEEEGF
jgi:hypothetical protein